MEAAQKRLDRLSAEHEAAMRAASAQLAALEHTQAQAANAARLSAHTARHGEAMAEARRRQRELTISAPTAGGSGVQQGAAAHERAMWEAGERLGQLRWEEEMRWAEGRIQELGSDGFVGEGRGGRRR
ncbi:hypothetical protein F4778DRAFT_799441 [Xylariomycetidae sp. FL2044]|nr:hypothetical protein F4778DRAFT_799441 [Xylariomycetidae sp. FL2044]